MKLEAKAINNLFKGSGITEEDTVKHTFGYAVNVGYNIGRRSVDSATIVLLSFYHQKANQSRGIQISDIDTLIQISEKFENKYNGTDWEKNKKGWEQTVIDFYNKNIPTNWDKI